MARRRHRILLLLLLRPCPVLLQDPLTERHILLVRSIQVVHSFRQRISDTLTDKIRVFVKRPLAAARALGSAQDRHAFLERASAHFDKRGRAVELLLGLEGFRE